jgi:hypothetical protein
MFSVFCPTHGSEVLLGSRSIERIDNTAEGIHLHWRCYCGTRGVQRFGDHLDHQSDVAVAA